VTSRLYNERAWIYEALPSQVDYRALADTLDCRVARWKQSAGRRLLDVGCGVAAHHPYLGDRYDISGIDANAGVLDRARTTCAAADYRLGDMRDFEVDAPFDIVTCLDSLCYCWEPAAFRRAAACLARALAPGGILIAAIDDLADNFQQNRTFTLQGRWQGSRVLLIENAFDPDPSDTWFDHSFTLVIDTGADVQVDVERHRLGLFSAAAVVEFFGQAGLDHVASEPLRSFGSATAFADDGRVMAFRKPHV
jgi:SAM-dependent methyltransferase